MKDNFKSAPDEFMTNELALKAKVRNLYEDENLSVCSKLYLTFSVIVKTSMDKIKKYFAILLIWIIE